MPPEQFDLEPCPECKSKNGKVVMSSKGFHCECDDCGFSTIVCASALMAITLWNDFSIVNNQWLESEK